MISADRRATSLAAHYPKRSDTPPNLHREVAQVDAIVTNTKRYEDEKIGIFHSRNAATHSMWQQEN